MTSMAANSIGLKLKNLHLGTKSLVELRFACSEHELDRVELWSIWRKGEGYPASVGAEFLYQGSSMNRGVVED